MLFLKNMQTQDGKSATGSSGGSEIGNSHTIFHDVGYIDFFSLAAAEAMVDKVTTFHSHQCSNVRDHTARVLQSAVRCGQTLIAASEADSAHQHFWTIHVPVVVAPNKKAWTGKQDNSKDKQGTHVELANLRISKLLLSSAKLKASSEIGPDQEVDGDTKW